MKNSYNKEEVYEKLLQESLMRIETSVHKTELSKRGFTTENTDYDLLNVNKRSIES